MAQPANDYQKMIILRTISLFLIFIILFASCSPRKAISTLIKTGQTREQIEKTLGEPEEIKNFKKASNFIWGPEETFWDGIPNGTLLEVWHYKDSDGQLNLYFIDGNDSLSYQAYVPNGVLYESDQSEEAPKND